MPDTYILEGHTPVPCDDILTWAKWLQANEDKRRVAIDEINSATISTVFLGLNHAFGYGPPLIFETMVFTPPSSHSECYCARCSTWNEALEQHRVACEWVRNGMAERDQP